MLIPEFCINLKRKTKLLGVRRGAAVCSEIPVGSRYHGTNDTKENPVRAQWACWTLDSFDAEESRGPAPGVTGPKSDRRASL